MEAFTFSEDSENRITIGGKRKSSSRRSSILKATKSPLKGGALDELDPNSLDDNGRSRSKKSRRSSGRRVSFAKKDDVKEFFVEDWKATWPKDAEENNLQMSSSASEGDSEYRAPAESIKGLESLLKGNIQADDNRVSRIKVQEMPEVQFNQLSIGDEDSAVRYDRGILLQTITQAQVQHTLPSDVTICHGPGIISAPNNDPETSRANPSEEMEYTKCHNSVLSRAVTNFDQTSLFSGDTGIDLDITCSQQEVFFRDYPNAQLSSPESLEQSDKMDSKSFLMSLGSKPSSTQTHEVIQHTEDFTTPNAYRKRQPLGEITGVQSAVKTSQGFRNQQSNLDENVELTACHSYKGPENIALKTNRRSIYELADIDVTSCYGPGLLKSFGKQELHSPDEARSQVSGAPTNLNVKRNSFETDLQSQAPSEQTALLDVTNCYGSGILPGKRVSVLGADQTVVYTNNADNTESLDLTVCQAEEQHDSDENLELTACHSYEVLDNSMSKTHQKSICEPADLDVTSCYGPGLIKSPENQVTNDYVTEKHLTLGRRPGAPVNRLHKNTSLNNAQDFCASEDASALISQTSRSATIANGDRSSFGKDYSTHQLPQHTDQLDITRCYGEGILPNQRLQVAEADQTLVFADNMGNHGTTESDSLDLTVCHPQQGQDTVPPSSDSLSLNHQNAHSFSCNGSSKMDSSVFLKFLGAKQHSSTTDKGEYDDEMDLTISGNIGTLPEDKREQQKPVEAKLSLESTVSCSKTNEVVTDRSNSTGFRNAYLIKNPFRKTTDKQEQVSKIHENLELTICHGQPVLDSVTQGTKRKSLYEPADLEVTSCYGSGLIQSPEKDETSNDIFKSALNLSRSLRAATIANKLNGNASFSKAPDVPGWNKTQQQESDFNDNLELTACHSQPFVGNNLLKTDRRSLFEPADIEITSCHGLGLVKSTGDSLESTVCGQPAGLDKSLQKANRRNFYEPADIDVTSCHGPGLVKSFVETSEPTVSHSQHAIGTNTQKTNRASVYEPADLDVTACQGAGLVKSRGESLELTTCHSKQVFDNSIHKINRRSLYEPADLDITSCQGAGLVKPNRESLQLTTCTTNQVHDNNTENATRGSFYEHADLGITSCSKLGLVKTPDEPVINDDVGITRLNLSERTEVSFHNVNANASLDKAEDYHYPEEVFQTTTGQANSNTSFECTDYNPDKAVTSANAAGLNQSAGDQITSDDVDRKLSIICEESVSELSKKELREDGNLTELEEMHNITQSPITLNKFLDITELAFITEVNMRRSIAPSNVVETPQTPKDIIISTLVSKPKAACYEEAIPAIESQITVMKEKVEQQEMELNASNPRVFMEAQSASKEELLAMQGKVRRLRSVCEKTSKREWKEGKGQLNKRILLKMTENHQSLASDVHVVEESLAMVDDCLNLLDKMDNDLDEGIKGFQLSLEENEKKLQEQANMAAELENMTKALRKSEQELADLECTRSTIQSEKQELVNRKEQLDVALLESEEAIRLLKKKQDTRSGKMATKEMSQKLDILESLQEWSLEEWNEERARFTFLKGTLEMVVLFGSDIADCQDSLSNKEVKSIQLNFTPTEQFSGKMGKVHSLVKQAVNQDILSQMCSSKKDLTKVLEHMSGIILKSTEIGEELFRIGLTHLMSFKVNRFVVEFSSLKAFVKFVLHIQLELIQSYPDSVTFTVSPMIGHVSQTEIEEALNAVEAGPRYLSRLVEAADQLLSKTKPILNMLS